MDIHHWLRHTADREPPDGRQYTVPDHMQAYTEDIDGEHATERYRRKRKRASSDCSLIEHPRRERAKDIRYACSTEHSRHITPSAFRHRSRDKSRSDDSPPREKQHRSYERRPRHKTKADRYEPRRKHEREHSTPRKSVPKRRVSRRSADGGRSAGVVQSFQLKNGPKNNRLTVCRTTMPERHPPRANIT